jgi:hypothetical protein
MGANLLPLKNLMRASLSIPEGIKGWMLSILPGPLSPNSEHPIGPDGVRLLTTSKNLMMGFPH